MSVPFGTPCITLVGFRFHNLGPFLFIVVCNIVANDLSVEFACSGSCLLNWVFACIRLIGFNFGEFSNKLKLLNRGKVLKKNSLQGKF